MNNKKKALKNIKFAISKSQISKCDFESQKSLYNYNILSSSKLSKNKKKSKIKINNNNSPKKEKTSSKKLLSKVSSSIDSINSNNNKNINHKFSLTAEGFINKVNKNESTEKNISKEFQDNNYKTISSINTPNHKPNNNFFRPMKTITSNMNKKWYNKYADKRIQRCLNQFNEKLFELQKPFELLYNNKNIKRNILPKINQNIFTSYDITK